VHRRRGPAVPVALTELRTALRRALAHAGQDTGVYVYDLDSGKSLYDVKAGVMRPPASVEKLYTTIAVLSRMDPNDRLKTVVVGDGHLERDGTWDGDLYLKGGGDPTFGDGTFNRTWEQGYGPTAADLAQQLRAAGIRRVTGRLMGDAGLFDSLRGGLSTNFAPDVPDFGGQLSALTFDHGATQGSLTPEAFAARQLARTLRAQHVKVKADRADGSPPRHARVLASVTSPPLSTLVRLMDVPSDDLFAEMLTKQLGARYSHEGTIAAGAKIISDVIGLYGLHPQIVDGSGLSRSDLSSPNQVVDLLRLVWRTQVGRLLSDALPVVGETGTVREIGVGTPAQGHCIAKTGTLNYVTNLAGYCASRNHHVLAFATFIDGPANWLALAMLTHVVAAMAKY
jgi:D-alanyl-D-alanine carboxypeptidase/D-alanyl-D-alanine-endopeptidase (penicillin-binding protein 4)